jgi:hypothetical protein
LFSEAVLRFSDQLGSFGNSLARRLWSRAALILLTRTAAAQGSVSASISGQNKKSKQQSAASTTTTKALMGSALIDRTATVEFGGAFIPRSHIATNDQQR